jgi:hypothetical protein
MGHLLLVPCSGDGDNVVVGERREKRKRGKEEFDFGAREKETKKLYLIGFIFNRYIIYQSRVINQEKMREN